MKGPVLAVVIPAVVMVLAATAAGVPLSRSLGAVATLAVIMLVVFATGLGRVHR